MDQMLTFAQFKEKTAISTLPLREKFYRGLVFNVGQIVEDANGVYEILDRGTNYVTVCNESGELSRKFPETLKESSHEPFPVTQECFKGYTPKHLTEDAKAAFGRVFAAYEGGTITDAIAVLKALKSVDSLFESFDQSSYETAIASLTRIGALEDHQYLDSFRSNLDEGMKSNQADKLKVAGIIADTLGASSSGTNPEIIVNSALRVAKRNSALMRGESFKIITRMLELAQSVGIDYDKKIITTKIDESAEHLIDKVRNAKTKALKKISKKIDNTICAEEKVHVGELDSIRKRMTSESFRDGVPVKVTKEDGKEMYGMVHGVHGSVVAVKHGNNRVTYHHNHKVSKHDGKGKENPKTFSDIANLGKKQDVDNIPQEFNDMQASTMTHSDNTARQMVVKKLKGL